MARQKVTGGTGKPEEKPTEAPPFDAQAVLQQDAAEASRKLVGVLETADKETDVTRARGVVFENANEAKEKAIDAQYPKLVETTFSPKDWDAAFARYQAWLELGDRRSEEAFIRKAHEQGPGILQSLYDVYFQVRYARELWEMENDVVFGRMREEATKVLELEKERKIRTKAITEADVAQKCASMFTDEWVRQESKRLRFKLTEDRAKSTIEVAGIRCKNLEGMMAKLR